MTIKKLRTAIAAISGVLGLVVGWSVITNNFIVPIIAIFVAAASSYFLKRATKDVTRDERTDFMNEKAALAAFKLSVPLIAFAGMVLFFLRDDLPAGIASAGYVLAYVACLLLVVHMAFFSYFIRKH